MRPFPRTILDGGYVIKLLHVARIIKKDLHAFKRWMRVCTLLDFTTKITGAFCSKATYRNDIGKSLTDLPLHNVRV